MRAMGETVSVEGICIKAKHPSKTIRFKVEMNKELGAEAPVYIGESKHGNNYQLRVDSGMKIKLLQTENIERSKAR